MRINSQLAQTRIPTGVAAKWRMSRWIPRLWCPSGSRCSTAASAAASIRLIMTGVASTGTRPLPMRGAVCSGPTSRSADPFIPIFKCDSSIIENCQSEIRVAVTGMAIVPDAVWEFNRWGWSRRRPDERQPRFQVLDLAQVRGTFGHDDFKGRANVSFAQVPGHRGSIALGDDQMKMERRLARGSFGDIADEGRDFDLFAHRNLQIILFVPIEVHQ